MHYDGIRKDSTDSLQVRYLGRRQYADSWARMQEFTAARKPNTPDELWVVEHEPVFTLGQAGKRTHILEPGHIPVVQTDRGGQVTYHGPGQLVVYVLVDLRRRGLGVRTLVNLLEQAVIDFLKEQGIEASRQQGAPGVYVIGAKVAALGLRIRHGCSYHGLALNCDMDLSPFRQINPCGYPGLMVTQLKDLGCRLALDEVATSLADSISARLFAPGRSQTAGERIRP